jgi:DNA invertase Pin-like site-specific DNA recombinase
MTKQPLRLIGYVRVSTAEQARSGLGAAAQRAKIAEAVARDGHQIVDVIADDGEHGTSLQRPGLHRALEAIAAGEADGLVAVKLDRVSRSVVDFGTLLAWFTEAKAALVILDPAIDTTTAAGRLVANVFASVAEWEADTITERTRDALAAKRARGERIGRPAVVEDARLAKRIRSMRDRGMTLRAIADKLNEDGVPTVRSAARWQVSAVQSVLGYRRPPGRRNADLPDPRPRRRTRVSA